MDNGIRGFTSLILLATALSLIVGCQTQEKHYTLSGRVVAKSPSAGQLSVDGDNIPGFMPAMIMPYPVKDTQGLAAVEPGDRITANVVVRNNDDYWVDHITITDKSERGPFSASDREKVPAVRAAHSAWRSPHAPRSGIRHRPEASGDLHTLPRPPDRGSSPAEAVAILL